MVKEKEEILEIEEEPIEEKTEKKQDIKEDKKEAKKTKKSKKDVASDLDDLLYGGKIPQDREIDMGEVPEFMSLKPSGKKTKEEVPEYLRY